MIIIHVSFVQHIVVLVLLILRLWTAITSLYEKFFVTIKCIVFTTCSFLILISFLITIASYSMVHFLANDRWLAYFALLMIVAHGSWASRLRVVLWNTWRWCHIQCDLVTTLAETLLLLIIVRSVTMWSLLLRIDLLLLLQTVISIVVLLWCWLYLELSINLMVSMWLHHLCIARWHIRLHTALLLIE